MRLARLRLLGVNTTTVCHTACGLRAVADGSRASVTWRAGASGNSFTDSHIHDAADAEPGLYANACNATDDAGLAYSAPDQYATAHARRAADRRANHADRLGGL